MYVLNNFKIYVNQKYFFFILNDSFFLTLFFLSRGRGEVGREPLPPPLFALPGLNIKSCGSGFRRPGSNNPEQNRIQPFRKVRKDEGKWILIPTRRIVHTKGVHRTFYTWRGRGDPCCSTERTQLTAAIKQTLFFIL